MYTETQQALRNSLWNFMGAMLTASVHEENRKKENVTALISEELCKFCKIEEENKIDMKAAKPILKAAAWVLECKEKELLKLYEEAPDVAKEAINNNIDKINYLYKELNDYIDKITIK